MTVKTAWSWKGFKEGIADEGVPLAGATAGAALGGLRGAALGYAVGGGASILRSKLRGEEPSMSRKLLAAGALGYGVGGLGHAAAEHLTHGARAGSIAQRAFHPTAAKGTMLSRGIEEALPAAGATLGTGVAMGTHKEKKPMKKAASVKMAAFSDELNKIAADFGLVGRAARVAGQTMGKTAPAAAKTVKPSGHDMLAAIRAAKTSGRPTTLNAASFR